MKLAVIGTGYVGLVTVTCFAETGHRVTCVDVDAKKVELLRAGGIPIYEPGLEELVRRNAKEGRLDFTTSTAEAMKGTDVVSNPEFLKEGAAIDDFMRPDRVVVGCASEKARAVMAELYAPFVRAEQPVLFMDLRSAELTKYAANAMLDRKSVV